MHLLLLATLAHAFDDWEYTANELRVPASAEAPVAFVGTVKSWKPVYLHPTPQSVHRPEGPCHTEYVFSVQEVVRGAVAGGKEFTALWGGCKSEGGGVATMIAGSPAPPPTGVKLLLFLATVESLDRQMPVPEGVFWINDAGGGHRISNGRWDVAGRPSPGGDPIVNVGGLLTVKPGPHTTYADAEAVLAKYGGGRPVTLAELTAAIRSGRIDDVPSAE